MTIGRTSSRMVLRNGPTANDTFANNKRSELINAVVSDVAHSYGYDKAPDGCKGAWTNCAAGLPRRGEGAMGRARCKSEERYGVEGFVKRDIDSLDQLGIEMDRGKNESIPAWWKFAADGKGTELDFQRKYDSVRIFIDKGNHVVYMHFNR